MTDNRTTELREKLNKLIVELDRLDIALDSPASDMTLGEYEQEREKLLDGFIQAIAATLGNTTCEYVIEDNMNETEDMGDVWFRCTNCDMCFDYADDWLLKMPYCPHCGARVKARNE